MGKDFNNSKSQKSVKKKKNQLEDMLKCMFVLRRWSKSR